MIKAVTIVAITGFMAVNAPANAATKAGVWDRIEDRVDRRESYRDRQVTHGPKDRFEDRVDRWEDRRDRAGKSTPRVVNRWERRSIKKRFGN